ncbi:MAG: transketolase [Oscillospiraceae bacterium]|nr:transketolase [Oscillospiraceae bacterium]MCL2278424.1 transketolase [Oscillospiraceae bacterium]
MSIEKDTRELRVVAEGIRLVTLQTFANIGFGHVGGAMSIIEALAALYGGELRTDPDNPQWNERDRLVMSKGHAGPALYSTLCLRGFFQKEKLLELNQGGGSLPSHCDMHKTIGIDMTTGSLGQGFSTAIGLALGARLNEIDNYTYLIIGDGECNEGQVWEGAMFAAHHKLGRLIVLVDWNKQQLDGFTNDIIDMGDFVEKFKSFGFHTQLVDGHDPGKIKAAIIDAKRYQDAPSAIILDTIKGYGCNFAEAIASNHHMNFTKEQIDKAIDEVSLKLEEVRELANKKA